MKRQKDRTPKDELPRSVGAQYAIGDQRNNSRKNEESEQCKNNTQLWMCSIEQYSIGTWKVRSMNQGKLDLVKHEMARVNIDILGIGELK